VSVRQPSASSDQPVAQPGSARYRSIVLRTFATLMLLLQLRPFAGAAICLNQVLSADQKCEMALPDAANHDAPAPNSSGTAPIPRTDCPLAQLCAVPAGAVLSFNVTTPIATTEAVTTLPPYTDKLFAADPAAPLVPPPNR
jgi:hypothetical protein